MFYKLDSKEWKKQIDQTSEWYVRINQPIAQGKDGEPIRCKASSDKHCKSSNNWYQRYNY